MHSHHDHTKTKSYGYFDYQYVQPQYHVEKFHTDEKHARKYDSDTHSAGNQERSNGGYYSKGHDKYQKSHGAHGSHHGGYKEHEGSHGHSKNGHESGYGKFLFIAQTRLALSL
ncbi:unnamed protein product [Haemonchus placei]|uniref:Uncharacterized protein n=1 Tax=Haemonchus placei TaxID=6290 RepID=A0A3P8D1Q8_HAEPC|nr:unnamed protein product [Haemonchus placei]